MEGSITVLIYTVKSMTKQQAFAPMETSEFMCIYLESAMGNCELNKYSSRIISVISAVISFQLKVHVG